MQLRLPFAALSLPILVAMLAAPGTARRHATVALSELLAALSERRLGTPEAPVGPRPYAQRAPE